MQPRPFAKLPPRKARNNTLLERSYDKDTIIKTNAENERNRRLSNIMSENGRDTESDKEKNESIMDDNSITSNGNRSSTLEIGNNRKQSPRDSQNNNSSIRSNNPSLRSKNPSIQSNDNSYHYSHDPSIQVSKTPSINSNNPSDHSNHPSIHSNNGSVRSNNESVRSNNPSIRSNNESIRSNDTSNRSNDQLGRWSKNGSRNGSVNGRRSRNGSLNGRMSRTGSINGRTSRAASVNGRASGHVNPQTFRKLSDAGGSQTYRKESLTDSDNENRQSQQGSEIDRRSDDSNDRRRRFTGSDRGSLIGQRSNYGSDAEKRSNEGSENGRLYFGTAGSDTESKRSLKLSNTKSADVIEKTSHDGDDEDSQQSVAEEVNSALASPRK